MTEVAVGAAVGIGVGMFVVGLLTSAVILLLVPKLYNLLSRLLRQLSCCCRNQPVKRDTSVRAVMRQGGTRESYAEIELGQPVTGGRVVLPAVVSNTHVTSAQNGDRQRPECYENLALRHSDGEVVKYQVLQMDDRPVYQGTSKASEAEPYQITHVGNNPAYYEDVEIRVPGKAGSQSKDGVRQSRTYFILEPVSNPDSLAVPSPSRRRKKEQTKPAPFYYTLKPTEEGPSTPVSTRKEDGPKEDLPNHTYFVLMKQS